MSIKSDKQTMTKVIKDLGLEVIVPDSALNTFYSMKWRVENEIHLFSFIGYLKLVTEESIPLYYSASYPQLTIDAFKNIDLNTSHELEKHLKAHYHKGWGEKEEDLPLAEKLSAFTLSFLNDWKTDVNSNFMLG